MEENVDQFRGTVDVKQECGSMPFVQQMDDMPVLNVVEKICVDMSMLRVSSGTLLRPRSCWRRLKWQCRFRKSGCPSVA